jgi:hypothetical protein
LTSTRCQLGDSRVVTWGDGTASHDVGDLASASQRQRFSEAALHGIE